MTGVQVRNGIVDIDVPTDEDAKQCARLLKDQQGPTFRSLDLRRGVVTSAGASVIAKGLKGKLTRGWRGEGQGRPRYARYIRRLSFWV